jgi:TetR/AcrR family transcriptional repressor of nem operon
MAVKRMSGSKAGEVLPEGAEPGLQERGQARRTRIVNTAIRLMWRDGYAAVGLDRILREAGATKGSFYHFFDSKSDLLIACLDHVWRIQRQQLEAILTSAPTGRAALDRLVGWYCEAQESAFIRHGYVPGLFHTSILDAVGFGDLIQARLRMLVDDYEQMVVAMMARIIKEEGLTADPAILADAVSGVIGGLILKGRTRNDLAPIRRIPVVVESLLSAYR